MNINQEPIYAITCLTKLEEDERGWPDFGAIAFMGFFHEKEIAFDDVKSNALDIAECCYNYAVIEEINPGMYSLPRNRWFFKYCHNEDCFVEIDEPQFMEHIANVM